MNVQVDYRPSYTVSDYEQWEGDWELILGLPYAMTSPTRRHQQVSRNISIELDQALENCDQCEALFALDWRIDENTVLQPDNVVVCGRGDEPFLCEPPALIFEILSPSTAYIDRHLKHQIYESEGVRHYVIVDAEAEDVEVYSLESGRYEKRDRLQEDRIAFDLGSCMVEIEINRLWNRRAQSN